MRDCCNFIFFYCFQYFTWYYVTSLFWLWCPHSQLRKIVKSSRPEIYINSCFLLKALVFLRILKTQNLAFILSLVFTGNLKAFPRYGALYCSCIFFQFQINIRRFRFSLNIVFNCSWNEHPLKSSDMVLPPGRMYSRFRFNVKREEIT